MPEPRPTNSLLTYRFQRAFALASEVHRTQLRKDTTIPYMAHLMSVAALVLENGGGEDTAIGGLLHDAVEDSTDGKAMKARIHLEFGDRIADIVMGCSDAVAVPGEKKPPWAERKAAYIEHLRAETDPDILLVSACDKLHNARAILGDLRNPAIGAAVWQRFSVRDPEQQIGYYENLAASYTAVPATLRDELLRVVVEMRTLSGVEANR